MLNYQSIFENGPPSCLYRNDGLIVSANPAFCQLLGYTETSLVNTPIWELLEKQQQSEYQQSLETKQSEQAEYEFIHRLGYSLSLSEHRSQLKDEQGTLYIGQFHDISQNRRSLQRLELIEERFKLSQRHAHYGVWDWNIQTNDLYWSDQIGPLIGHGKGEIEANYADFIEAMHPDDRDYVGEAVRAAVEDGAEYDIEHRVVWPDGTVRWIRETGDIIRDETGTPVNMIGVARDVTAHHLDSEALKESTQQLKQAQSIAHVGHWSWDVASGDIFWSDEIFRIFGYQPGEFEPTYEKFIATLHPDDIERIKRSEAAAFAEGKAHSIDHRIIRPDGSEAWVHEEAVAINDKQGKPIRLTGTVQDINERKLLEQKLADKIEQAQAANLAKSTFLSHMSHELRTPLNGILGFAQVMQMEDLSDTLANYVKEIMSSGWHLLDLVDDLLDLSSIDTGNINLQLETVDLNELMHECHSIVNPMLTERKLQFKAPYEECTHFVKADRRRLKQVLINLLSNAVKYNRQNGFIEVSCEITDQTLRINIKDSGQGISQDLLPRLFTPFDRLGKEGIEESGTGIGLTLVKRLTETMGGEIGVRSKVGEGSTFWVEFPLASEQDFNIAENNSNYIQQRSEMTTTTIKVLYVEDNPANLRLIEGFMAKKEQFELSSANTAAAGLEMAKQQLPDIILMDIKLPDMNGFEALAHLKANNATANIPVIAVSAVAHEHDVAAGLNAGFYRYITKPVNLEQLEEAMYYALRDSRMLPENSNQAPVVR